MGKRTRVEQGRSFGGRKLGVERLEERRLLDAGGVEALSGAEAADVGPPPIIVAEALAVFRSGLWFFDTDFNGGPAEMVYAFGVAGDVPVAGDFDDNGFHDATVFRDGMWYFDLNNAGGAAEAAFAFGIPGDVPVAGDWDGDGVDEAGVFRNGVWYFDLDGAGGVAEAAIAFGAPGDVPVAGDWDGDGTDEAGVFRNGIWFFDFDNAGGAAEGAIAFGITGDVATSGNFNVVLSAEAVVFRDGQWFIDLDGAGGMGEMFFQFGTAGDVPFIGRWSTAALSDGVGAAGAGLGDEVVPWLVPVERDANEAGEAAAELPEDPAAGSGVAYSADGEVGVPVGVGAVETQRDDVESVDDAVLTLVAEWNAIGALPKLPAV